MSSDSRGYHPERTHSLMERGARPDGVTAQGPHPLSTAAPKSLDQARLLPRYRAMQPPAFTPGFVDTLPAESLGQITSGRTAKVFKPEAGDLRGIPIVGPGVGGVSPGTHPERETVRKLSRDRAA